MPSKKDLTGQRFNSLIVLSEVPREERKNIKKVEWKCKCDCGNQVCVISNYLISGHTKSCGCRRADTARKNFTKDLTGKIFSKLTALSPTEKRGGDGSIIWKCKCECGNIHYASTNSLTTGAIGSCGCMRSRGEFKINHLLFENNIHYRSEFLLNRKP